MTPQFAGPAFIFTAGMLVVLGVVSAAYGKLEPITGGTIVAPFFLLWVLWTDRRLRR